MSFVYVLNFFLFLFFCFTTLATRHPVLQRRANQRTLLLPSQINQSYHVINIRSVRILSPNERSASLEYHGKSTAAPARIL